MQIYSINAGIYNNRFSNNKYNNNPKPAFKGANLAKALKEFRVTSDFTKRPQEIFAGWQKLLKVASAESGFEICNPQIYEKMQAVQTPEQLEKLMLDSDAVFRIHPNTTVIAKDKQGVSIILSAPGDEGKYGFSFVSGENRAFFGKKYKKFCYYQDSVQGVLYNPVCAKG